MRSVKPWAGKTDDSKVPPHVRVRIFEKHNGICHVSKRRIRAGEKWELEHIIALCNGGKHEEGNMAPALVDPHKVKTKQDRAIKKRNDKIQKAHLGVKKPRSIRQWRKFNGEIVTATRER